MKNNFTLKYIALIAFTFVGIKAQAQTYYADGTLTTKKPLSVDIDPIKGSGNETAVGSPGSRYTWTSTAGLFIATDPDNTDLTDNKATIDWDATWPVSGGNPLDLIKDYEIKVVENSTCPPANLSDATTKIDVKLVKADVLKISTSASNVCYIGTSTPKIEIELQGTPGAVVNFAVAGGSVTIAGTTTATSATFDTTGKVIVEVSPTGGNIKLTVNDVVYSKPQPSGVLPALFEATTVGTSIVFNSGIPNNNVFEVVLGEAPKTSPIVF